MKRILLMLFCAVALNAQQMTDTTPAFVPATATDIITADAKIYQLILTNTTTSAVTNCKVTSRQATPITLFDDFVNGKNGTGGSHYIFVYPYGAPMPNGVTISCSTGSAVTYRLAYRLQ